MRTSRTSFYKELEADEVDQKYEPVFPMLPYSYTMSAKGPFDALKPRMAKYQKLLSMVTKDITKAAKERKDSGQMLSIMHGRILAMLNNPPCVKQWDIEEHGLLSIDNAWCVIPINTLLWLYCLDREQEAATRKRKAIFEILIDRCSDLKKKPGGYGLRASPVTQTAEGLITGRLTPNMDHLTGIQDLIAAYSVLLVERDDITAAKAAARGLGIQGIQKHARTTVSKLLDAVVSPVVSLNTNLLPERKVDIGTGKEVAASQIIAPVSPSTTNFAKVFVMVAMPLKSALLLSYDAIGCSWGTTKTWSKTPYARIAGNTIATMIYTLNHDLPEKILHNTNFIGAHYLW